MRDKDLHTHDMSRSNYRQMFYYSWVINFHLSYDSLLFSIFHLFENESIKIKCQKNKLANVSIAIFGCIAGLNILRVYTREV